MKRYTVPPPSATTVLYFASKEARSTFVGFTNVTFPLCAIVLKRFERTNVSRLRNRLAAALWVLRPTTTASARESERWENCQSSLLVHRSKVFSDSEMRSSILAATNATKRVLRCRRCCGYILFTAKNWSEVFLVNVKAEVQKTPLL